MEELKKEFEVLLAKFTEFQSKVEEVEYGDIALYEYALEKFEDVVGCLDDLADSLDENKFMCSECYEYKNIEERDGRIIDEDGEGICIYCADEFIMNAEAEEESMLEELERVIEFQDKVIIEYQGKVEEVEGKDVGLYEYKK